jgi:NAD(P)-dependent dehydrogenase (short-subunit alcohol dehydrogenase family)
LAALGHLGVRANAIAPGPVYTGGSSRDRIAQLGSTTLLDRAAEPEEVAEVIAFLASLGASHLTGATVATVATVAADGGRTAVWRELPSERRPERRGRLAPLATRRDV